MYSEAKLQGACSKNTGKTEVTLFFFNILVNTRFDEIYFLIQAQVMPLAVPSDEPMRTRSRAMSSSRSGRLEVRFPLDFSKLSFLGILGVLGSPKNLGFFWDFLGIFLGSQKIWDFFGIFLGLGTFAGIF